MPEKEFFSKHLAAAHRYCMLELSRQLEEYGIGMGQHSYLLALRDEDGITQEQLTSRLILNKSSVARATAQLENLGYLRREVTPGDRRSYRLYLTARGEAVTGRILERLEQVNLTLADGLSPQEQREAAALLRRMAANAEAAFTRMRGQTGASPKKEELYER